MELGFLFGMVFMFLLYLSIDWTLERARKKEEKKGKAVLNKLDKDIQSIKKHVDRIKMIDDEVYNKLK